MNVREEEERIEEERIRRQTFETALAWGQAGELKVRKDGEQFSITFTDEEMAALQGTVFTHNHPCGLEFPQDDPRSFNSFSEQDLRLACHAGLREMRVVTPRLRFSLKPPTSGWDQDYWGATMAPAYAQHRAAVVQQLLTAVKSGHVTVEEAEAQCFHEICSRVARALRLPYVREES